MDPATDLWITMQVQDILHELVETGDQQGSLHTPSEFLDKTIADYPTERHGEILSRFAVQEAPRIKAVAAVALKKLPSAITSQTRRARRQALMDDHVSFLDKSWGGSIDDWLPIKFRPSTEGPGRHKDLSEQIQCISTVTTLAMKKSIGLSSL